MEADIKKIRTYVHLMLVIVAVTSLVVLVVACLTLPRIASAMTTLQEGMTETLESVKTVSQSAADKMDSINVDALNEAIRNFRDAIAPLAEFMNKFK